MPLSDFYSLFTEYQNTTTSTPIKERAFVVYGRNGTYSANGRRVAAQPYLIVEETTLYFFSNFNFEVCVKTKTLYVELLQTDIG